MKMSVIRIFLSVLLVSVFAENAKPQQTDSLMAYLEIATKNNPSVLQKFYEYQAALQKVPQVGSLPDPQLDLGVFLSPMELVNGAQVADIKLMQMFPWFGTLKSARDEMSLMAKAKFEEMRDAKLQVFYDVQSTWYELYRVRKDIEILKQSVSLLETIEQLSLVNYKTSGTASTSTTLPSGSMANPQTGSPPANGMQPMGGNVKNNEPGQNPVMPDNSMNNVPGSGLIDIYRIQIEIAEVNNNIASLAGAEKTVAVRFNNYLNRTDTSRIFTPDSLEPASIILSGNVGDSAIAANPMLSMLQYEQQSLDARKKMVTRMGYPMIGIGIDYSLIQKDKMSSSSMNGRDMIMPMISVTLPIYRKKYNAMKKEADYLKEASRQNYMATANSLQTQYSQALQALGDASRNLNLYDQQLQLVNKSFDILLKSYSVSGAGLTDVLQLQRQLLDYRLKQVQALANYNTAVALINRLLAKNESK